MCESEIAPKDASAVPTLNSLVVDPGVNSLPALYANTICDESRS
jgi:hypothetical protein